MISVIISTFNSIEFIKPCLASLFAQDSRDFEVIIVDNGSGDGTVDFLKNNYPQIILIENEQNLGACKARNQGIEVATGDWILTLDCDVVLNDNFLSQIIKATENISPKTGMIQPKILKADRETIYSNGIFLSFSRRFYDIDRDETDNGQFNSSKYIFGACCAAAVYSRRMLEEIKEETGYFDERFFFLVEDVDLAWRAQKRGWTALFYPEPVCYHSGNSSRLDKKLRQYLCFRNRYYSIIKNEGLVNYSIKLFPLLFYDLPRLLCLILTNSYIFRKPL